MEHKIFTNTQIHSSKVPSIGEVTYESLSKDYLTVLLVSTAIFWLIAGTGLAILILFNPWEGPGWLTLVLLSVLLVLVVISFVFTHLGYRRKEFAMRTHDILVNTGLIWRSFTVLPFARVQHAEVQQGPIERLFSLSKLKIYTAGGSGSDMVIPGLKPERAQAMKHFILEHTTIQDEQE